jgi:predicted TIM-barrel fold metal-dependent hydrolase
MIIDCHTHIDRANKKNWTPELLIESMNQAGIDYSLVISNHVTEAPLDVLLQRTKGYDRFRVIGNIEYKALDENHVNKLIDHLERKEIVGVKLYPGYEDYYPYDKKLYPLFSYMEKHNHPLMIHSGVLMVGCPGYLEQAHPLHVDKIAHNFPQLKIVIAHMGNPWLTDTLAVMWQNPNVYTDLSAFFVEFQPIDPKDVMLFLTRMREMKEFLGSFRRCLFGTDWPLYSQKEYLDAVKQIGFTDEERDLIFWKNANTIFNLAL